MRYVKNPGVINIKDPETGELVPDGDWTLYKFFIRVVLPDPAFGKGYEADRARTGVEKGSRQNKKVVALEDDQWDKCVKALKEPQGEMNNLVRMQLYPYQEAVVEASKEEPGKKKK